MGNHNPKRQRQTPKRDDRGVHLEAEYDEGWVRVWDPVQKAWSSERRPAFTDDKPAKKAGKGKK